MRNKPRLANPIVLRDAVRQTLERHGIRSGPATRRIDAAPIEEGPAGIEAKSSLEKAIAEFNPNTSFTNKCLVRMAFLNRYLSDREKILVLEMVKRYYATDKQQLTLVNFIGYLRGKRSDEAHLPEILASMKQTGNVLDVGPHRRADDSDLLLELSGKAKKTERPRDVSDKDY